MRLKGLRQSLPLLLGDSLTLFLLLAGGMFSFLGVGDGARELLACCALASLLAAVAWNHPKGHWAALGGTAISLLLLLWLWASRPEEWSYMGLPSRQLFLSLPSVRMALSFLLALVLGWVVVWARSWLLALLLVITPLAPGLLDGALPDWTAFMAVFVGLGTMMLTALFSHRDRSSLGTGILLSLGGMAALTLLLTNLLPQEGYERPQWATDARDRLLSTLSEAVQMDWDAPEFLDEYLYLEGTGGGDLSDAGGPASFAVDDTGHVDLLDAGPRRYSNRPVMTVQGAKQGAFYLRGGSAAVYNGESWEDIGLEASLALQEELSMQLELGGSVEPALFPAMTALEGEMETMTVRHYYPGTAAYFPYRLIRFLTPEVDLETFLPTGTGLTGESRAVKEMDLEEYRVLYSPGGPSGLFAPLSGDAAVAEEIYRDFVYSNYLDVPQAARGGLSAIERPAQWPADPLSELPEQWQRASQAAREAAAALSRAARYDLSTPAMEPGEDFVAHFLEEGRGYCVHFATAGALLLRMQGIPARYVSGYVAHADRMGAAAVLDSDSHAWVEVYLDGYGWYPVEMTPGYGSGMPGPDGVEYTEPEEEEEPEEEPEEEEQEPEEPEEEAPEGPEDKEAPETPEELVPPELSGLWQTVAAAQLLAAPFLIYALGVLLRRRSRNQPDANRATVAAYLRYRRAVRWGGEEEPGLEELARKAKFSQHQLTEEERERAWSLLERAAGRLEHRLPWWKLAAFRCLRPLF